MFMTVVKNLLNVSWASVFLYSVTCNDIKGDSEHE